MRTIKVKINCKKKTCWQCDLMEFDNRKRCCTAFLDENGAFVELKIENGLAMRCQQCLDAEVKE